VRLGERETRKAGETGKGKWECGMGKVESFDFEFGIADCGLRPLRAVGSIYEPEAVGAIMAYAPEGRGKDEAERIGNGA
jgi:hypothetical protein